VTQDYETWFDEAAGPMVRPYTVTRGRTRTRRTDLQMITLVIARAPVPRIVPQLLGPEHVQILSMCQSPTSVAEVSARLALPLSVVKILLSDLIDRQLVTFRSAATIDVHVLQAVIDGIRQL
jgi:hypothetical protein